MTATDPSPVRVSREMRDLLAIMAALRDPETGCAWDIRQTFGSIARYTVEEAYEVADAIARNDLPDLCDELGDLLLQVVFHARIAEEAGAFAFGDVVEAITAKLIRRHPHIFGPRVAGGARPLDPDAVKALWDDIKAKEKAERSKRRAGLGKHHGPLGLLSDIPATMPALLRADRLSRRAATVGFVWQHVSDLIAKIHEEVAEVTDAIDRNDRPAIEDEIGDLLFTAANLARHFDIDPERALAGTNAKFERRFRAMETMLVGQGREPRDADLSEFETLWQEAKRQERAS